MATLPGIAGALRRPCAVLAVVALTLGAAGCAAGTGAPEQLPKDEGAELAEASRAITGACARGPLTPAQETALQPRVERLIDATKRHPDTLFEYPQEDQNPLLTTPSLELQAAVGALGGVGLQPVCSRRLAALGDRGLTDAGLPSMLRDIPSARE